MKSHPIVPLLLHGVLIMTFTVNLSAQTTLSGDHVIEGNLDVGTTSTPSALEITGQTGSTALPGIKVTGHGGVLFEGTFGQGSIPTEGAGTRFMWYPKKAALRVGRVGSWYWDDNSIGNDSIALGLNSRAYGENSVALAGGVADDTNAIALGTGSVAGMNSAAMSHGRAWGQSSTAMSGGYLDDGSKYSVALARGEIWGHAEDATAITGGIVLFADSAIAIGAGTSAHVAYSMVVGTSNTTLVGDLSNWVETDPLFIIGNGRPGVYDLDDNPIISPTYSDALVVYKNGNITIPKRQGDISMGEFGNPGD